MTIPCPSFRDKDARTVLSREKVMRVIADAYPFRRPSFFHESTSQTVMTWSSLLAAGSIPQSAENAQVRAASPLQSVT